MAMKILPVMIVINLIDGGAEDFAAVREEFVALGILPLLQQLRCCHARLRGGYVACLCGIARQLHGLRVLRGFLKPLASCRCSDAQYQMLVPWRMALLFAHAST